MRNLLAPEISIFFIVLLGCAGGQTTIGSGDHAWSPRLTVESHVDVSPSFLDYVAPEYPRLARQAQLEGTATVRALVSTLGTITSVEIAGTSGTPSLDEAARTAAFASRYRPAVINHSAIEVWVRYDVVFELE